MESVLAYWRSSEIYLILLLFNGHSIYIYTCGMPSPAGGVLLGKRQPWSLTLLCIISLLSSLSPMISTTTNSASKMF